MKEPIRRIETDREVWVLAGKESRTVSAVALLASFLPLSSVAWYASGDPYYSVFLLSISFFFLGAALWAWPDKPRSTELSVGLHYVSVHEKPWLGSSREVARFSLVGLAATRSEALTLTGSAGSLKVHGNAMQLAWVRSELEKRSLRARAAAGARDDAARAELEAVVGRASPEQWVTTKPNILRRQVGVALMTLSLVWGTLVHPLLRASTDVGLLINQTVTTITLTEADDGTAITAGRWRIEQACLGSPNRFYWTTRRDGRTIEHEHWVSVVHHPTGEISPLMVSMDAPSESSRFSCGTRDYVDLSYIGNGGGTLATRAVAAHPTPERARLLPLGWPSPGELILQLLMHLACPVGIPVTVLTGVALGRRQRPVTRR